MNTFIAGLVLLCLLSLSTALLQEGIIQCGTDTDWKKTGYDDRIRLNERQSANNVKFPTAHRSIPGVVVDVSQLDSLQSQNLRYQLRISAITKTGFSLSCVTWHKTHIFSLNVRWVSFDDRKTC
uniref:H-type lectin domain-containing protein n=1 Tax=Arion vulgaris TaxID=1028688 RepID=A0A0B6Z3C5_9EUPU